MTDEVKQDKRKTRWMNATPEERKAHGEKIRVGRAAAKEKRTLNQIPSL